MVAICRLARHVSLRPDANAGDAVNKNTICRQCLDWSRAYVASCAYSHIQNRYQKRVITHFPGFGYPYSAVPSLVKYERAVTLLFIDGLAAVSYFRLDTQVRVGSAAKSHLWEVFASIRRRTDLICRGQSTCLIYAHLRLKLFTKVRLKDIFGPACYVNYKSLKANI